MSAHSVTVRELDYVAGSSDKFYRVFLVGTAMAAQYGRSGTFGTFTPPKSFADTETAERAADKAVAGKLAKGYTLRKSGTLTFDAAPTESDLDRAAAQLTSVGAAAAMPQLREQSAVVTAANAATDIDPAVQIEVTAALTDLFGEPAGAASETQPTRPMLAAVAAPTEVKHLLASDRWVMQPKLDGDRVVVEIVDGAVSVLNRAGQPKAKNVFEAMLAPFRALTEGRWVFDGEVVGRTLHLFDLAAAAGWISETDAFVDRHQALTTVLGLLDADPATVRIVPVTSGVDSKLALLADAAAQQREGVMFRQIDAPYEPARRSTYLLKHKFVKEADCVVMSVSAVKESVTLGVHDADGTLREVGAASTIGKGAIAEGDVVEVHFLYVIDATNPRMYQPRIVRVRTDKAAAECSITQFAYAATNRCV